MMDRIHTDIHSSCIVLSSLQKMMFTPKFKLLLNTTFPTAEIKNAVIKDILVEVQILHTPLTPTAYISWYILHILYQKDIQ